MAPGAVRFVTQIGDHSSVTGRLPVAFTPTESAYLDVANEEFESQRYLLSRLQGLKWPAYVQTEATDSLQTPAAITAVKIPKAARVIGITPEATRGWFHVRLDSSAARHVVNTSTTDGPRIEAALWESLENNSFVFLVDDVDSHEILDASGVGGHFRRFSQSITAFSIPPKPPGILERLPEVAENRLTEMFGIAAQDTCSFPPKEGCSPFVFPDDGCWARAQRICEQLDKAGFTEAGRSLTCKVWIYGDLLAKTPNHPACEVRWDWHVAPIVNIGNSRYRVLDPAINPAGPLPYDEWRKRISGISQVRFTEAWVYKMAQPDELRGEILDRESDDTIEIFRLSLLERVNRLKRPPPYCQ